MKLEEACREIDEYLGVEPGMAVRYVRGKLKMTCRWNGVRRPNTIIDDWCWKQGERDEGGQEAILSRSMATPNTVRLFVTKSVAKVATGPQIASNSGQVPDGSVTVLRVERI
ncbi:MAG: hypothetical protein WC604_03035 [Candidatus Gracilibacteria bacterium]